VASVPERPTSAPADADPELWERVRDLPTKQRTAVFCRTVLGMPYDELAVLLESSEDAARRNVHEGLKRLKEELS
jgi:DNA-directed RNA polymerase specialized sigma24 family protein